MTTRSLTKRQQRLSGVLECLDSGLSGVEEIAAKLGIREDLAGRLIAQIIASKMDAISSRDVGILIKKSAANYEMLIGESMRDLRNAKTTEDRSRVYESWRRAQEAQDKLFSLCGLYVKKEKREITYDDVQDTPAWKQMGGLFEEFCFIKGIPFKEWTDFVKDRAMGKVAAIDVNASELDVDGNVVPIKVNPKKGQYMFGKDNQSLNINKYDPDYKHVNTLKAKFELGNVTQEEEDELFEMLSPDEQMEYIQWKDSRAEVEEKDKEAEDETHTKEE